MKVFFINRGVRSILFAPIFAAGWIGFTLPGVAANIFSFSTLDLAISNFSHPAKTVGIEADIDLMAIGGDPGKVEIQVGLDSLFFTDESTTFGYTTSESIVWAEGVNYLARKNLVSTLLGRFEIPANTEFSFDIGAYTSLLNFTSDLLSNPVTSLGVTSLFLKEVSSQKTIHVFDFTGLINTRDLEQQNADLVKFRKNSLMNVLEYTSQTSFGGEAEMIDFWLNASFHLSVSQDTEFELFASTRSCVDTSNGGGICTVPEPSTALGLLASAIGLSGFGLLREVMNRVVKFIL